MLRFEQVYRGRTGHDEKKADTRKTKVDKTETNFPAVKNRTYSILHFEQVYRGLTDHDEKKTDTRKTTVVKI
jgi:hypothetical protein